MLIFGNDLNARGCFRAFTLLTKGSRGAVMRMSNLTLPDENNYSDPSVIIGFSAQQKEKVSLVQCFQNRTYTYAFGHDPTASQLVVNFVGFLREGSGEESPGASRGLSTIVDQLTRNYKDNRVSINSRYVELSIGGQQTLKGFLVHMQTGTMSTEFNLQNFSYTLQLVEVQPVEDT